MTRSIELCALAASLALSASLGACRGEHKEPQSSSGAIKATVQIETDSSGYTVEQRNIMERLARDTKIGSIKHLYVFSAATGDTLLYSTVRGKVTSSGKRLTPITIDGNDAFAVRIGDSTYATREVLQDDGTYGSSIPYLFWFDESGAYHQHYVNGGQIVHISDQPIRLLRKPVVEIGVAPDGGGDAAADDKAGDKADDKADGPRDAPTSGAGAGGSGTR